MSDPTPPTSAPAQPDHPAAHPDHGDHERPSYDPFPLWEVAVAIAAVLLVVGVFVFLLFHRTTGPGEILKDFYQAAADGDCDAAYGYLTPQLQARMPQEQFCPVLDDAGLVPDFEVDQLTLTGDPGTSAFVIVTGGTSVGDPDIRSTWTFELIDDGWRIDGLCQSGDPALEPLTQASAAEDACSAAIAAAAATPPPAAASPATP